MSSIRNVRLGVNIGKTYGGNLAGTWLPGRTVQQRGPAFKPMEGLTSGSPKWLIADSIPPVFPPVAPDSTLLLSPLRSPVLTAPVFVVPVGWNAFFPDVARLQPGHFTAAQPPSLTGPVFVVPTGWGAFYPDAALQPPTPQVTGATAPVFVIPAGWGAFYPDAVPARGIIIPSGPVGPIGPLIHFDRAVAIFVPDEIPPNTPTTVSAEWIVLGVAVPFDPPGPTLSVFHLDVTGAEVVDLAPTLMTQYGVNPSYFLAWTPPATAGGVYMVMVQGMYMGTPIMMVQPVTIRPKFDPFALADSGILVSRM